VTDLPRMGRPPPYRGWYLARRLSHRCAPLCAALAGSHHRARRGLRHAPDGQRCPWGSVAAGGSRGYSRFQV